MNHWWSEYKLKVINIRVAPFFPSSSFPFPFTPFMFNVIDVWRRLSSMYSKENCSLSKMMLHELSTGIYCESTNDLLNKFSLIDQNYTNEKLSRRLFYYQNMSEEKYDREGKKSISGFPSSMVNILFNHLVEWEMNF
jgi:hypothetical protein